MEKKPRTATNCTILQLIPRHELVLENENDEEAIESHRIVVNNKLVDLAVKQCTTSRLDVLIKETEAREVTPMLYNDLWDALLVHGKAGVLDVRVTFHISAADGVEPEQILSAGPSLHPKSYPGSTSLASLVKEEAETPFVLYDNPRQVQSYRHKRVVLGGTFDRLHVGHKKLLSIAMQCADEKVIVGVTSDVMLANKRNADKIEKLNVRLGRVKEFLANNSYVRAALQIEVVVIHDPFGPTITEENIDAIVCSSETLKGALATNTERAKRGFKALLPILVLRSNTYVLSSTFIRDKLAL